MANLKSLPVGDKAPEVVHMVIEVPRGSGNKYEYDPDLGAIKLDRVLPGAQFYPGDYGFIPGVVVEVRVVGLLLMEDEKGGDAKVIGVVAEDQRLDHIQDIGDVPEGVKQEIQHFFETYKALEAKKGKWVKVTGWRDRKAALEEVRACIARYKG